MAGSSAYFFGQPSAAVKEVVVVIGWTGSSMCFLVRVGSIDGLTGP